ncbi:30S ribosomal protein S18 [Candidatus Parcubacteria bacterium]|nr:30S ribosomal protein S18 [Candidatus Parcubacteria bacterium]
MIPIVQKKECHFCKHNLKVIDYKDAELLRRFLTGQFKIAAPRRTGLCAKHQRALATAIKRARFLALLPYTFT